jgi:hypothetical protein
MEISPSGVASLELNSRMRRGAPFAEHLNPPPEL